MSFTEGTTVFLLSVSGQISNGHFPGLDNLYCHHSFVTGPDWSVTAGLSDGLSQCARRREGSIDHMVVWNFPVDATFRSTSPYGWPQIVLRVFEMNSYGKEQVRGYGAVHVPLVPGSHTAKVAMFVPESSSLIQRFTGYLMGSKPHYVDPRVVASGEGRDVTRVTSMGYVTVEFNVITKDLKRLGYEGSQRGPAGEVRNAGPSEGVGIVTKNVKH